MAESDDWAPEVAEIQRRRTAAAGVGGPDKVARQHATGRLTARERIALLAESGGGQRADGAGGWFHVRAAIEQEADLATRDDPPVRGSSRSAPHSTTWSGRAGYASRQLQRGLDGQALFAPGENIHLTNVRGGRDGISYDAGRLAGQDLSGRMREKTSILVVGHH